MKASGDQRPRSSRQRRRRARLRVRTDTNDRYRARRFQPRYELVLALQGDENQRRRIDGYGAAVADTAHRAANGNMMPGLSWSGLGRALRRKRPGTDRRHVKRVRHRICDDAKRRDRCKQLHQNRKHHDWNKTFQPPSHHFPQKRIVSPTPTYLLCRECRRGRGTDKSSRNKRARKGGSCRDPCPTCSSTF